MLSSSGVSLNDDAAVQAKLKEFKAISGQRLLDSSELEEQQILIAASDNLNGRTPSASVLASNGDSKDHAANGSNPNGRRPSKVNTIPRSSSRSDTTISIDGDRLSESKTNGNGNLKENLLKASSRSNISEEARRAYGYVFSRDYENLAKYLSSEVEYEISGGEELVTANETVYARLTKEEKQYIFNEYLAQNQKLYKGIAGHGWAGIAGEFLYLWWDYLARKKVTNWYLPSLGSDKKKFDMNVNTWLNVFLTFFVGAANITFDPRKEAKDVLTNTMLDPEKSLSKLIKNNKQLTLEFLGFAIGGSYIEVEQIFDDLDALGPMKIPAILAIIYAGTSYYGLFNFLDIIEGYNKWKNFPTVKPVGWDEWITKAFVNGHKTATVVERMARMGFGGLRCGQQLSGGNDYIGYTSAAFIAACTARVALATRALATHEIYYQGDKSVFPNGIPDAIYYKKKNEFEEKIRQSPLKVKLEHEASFFLAPTFLLQVPTVYFVANALANLVQDDRAKNALRLFGGAATALAGHLLVFRHPTKRAMIAKLCVEDELAKKTSNEGTANSPNTKALALSYVSNAVDQASRTLTLGYSLHGLFPSVFTNETHFGKDMLFLASMLQAFIAVSAYRYQVKKTNKAYPELAPGLFAVKANAANATTTTTTSDQYDQDEVGDYKAPGPVKPEADVNPVTVTISPAGRIN